MTTLRDKLIEKVYAILRGKTEASQRDINLIVDEILNIPELKEAIEFKERHDELCSKSCQEMWEREYKGGWRFPTAKLGGDKK